MASPAKFMDKSPTRTALSFDHDGWFTDPSIPQSDGFHRHITNRHFQMVPVAGDRLVLVQVDGKESFVFSRDDQIAAVGGENDAAPSSINRVVLPAGTSPVVHKVKVFGASKAGRTQIVVTDASRKVLDTVEVTVKSLVSKTYRLWGLRDKVGHKTSRTPQQMIDIMRDVERLYEKQANMRLSLIGRPEELKIDADLEDPIASPRLLLGRAAAAIKLSNHSTADFDLVSVWAFKRDTMVGISSELALVVLVQDYAPGQTLLETSTYAHELCHTFMVGGNLTHTLIPNMLMSGDGTDGFQMTITNIDKINRTGLAP